MEPRVFYGSQAAACRERTLTVLYLRRARAAQPLCQAPLACYAPSNLGRLWQGIRRRREWRESASSQRGRDACCLHQRRVGNIWIALLLCTLCPCRPYPAGQIGVRCLQRHTMGALVPCNCHLLFLQSLPARVVHPPGAGWLLVCTCKPGMA